MDTDTDFLNSTTQLNAALPVAQLPDHGGGIDAIIALTRQTGEIGIINLDASGLGDDGLPEVVPLLVDHRPGTKALTSVRDLIETYRTRPERRVGVAHAATLRSFINLTNRHKLEDCTAIFAKSTWPNPSLTAIVDYHAEDGTPGHCKHKIVYAFPVTEEMTAWIALNQKPMDQEAFALFLEEHISELVSPFDGEKTEYERLWGETFATPAALLGLSRKLEIHSAAKVKQNFNAQTGERELAFSEEHTNAMQGAGETVKIPGIFMVSIAAFIDGDPVRIPARLRYRLSGGKITWSYTLYRWQFWLANQVKNDMDTAAEDTGLPAFEGAPEA